MDRKEGKRINCCLMQALLLWCGAAFAQESRAASEDSDLERTPTMLQLHLQMESIGEAKKDPEEESNLPPPTTIISVPHFYKAEPSSKPVPASPVQSLPAQSLPAQSLPAQSLPPCLAAPGSVQSPPVAAPASTTKSVQLKKVSASMLPPALSKQILKNDNAVPNTTASPMKDANYKLKSADPELQKLFAQGQEKLKKERYTEAIAYFNKGLQMDKDEPVLYAHRAWAKRKLGDYDGAIEDYDAAIDKDGEQWRWYWGRSFCRRKVSDLHGALSDLNNVLELNPKNAQAMNERATIKSRLEDFRGSMADYKKAAQMSPRAQEIAQHTIDRVNSLTGQDLDIQVGKLAGNLSPELRQEISKANNQAVSDISSGDFAKAIERLQPIVAKAPSYDLAKENLAIAHNNLALKYSKAEHPHLALREFHQAFYYALDKDKSRINLNNALTLMGRNPNDFNVRVSEGDRAALTGDILGAQVEYEEALRLQEDPGARQKLRQAVFIITEENERQTSELADAKEQDQKSQETKLQEQK